MKFYQKYLIEMMKGKQMSPKVRFKVRESLFFPLEEHEKNVKSVGLLI